MRTRLAWHVICAATMIAGIAASDLVSRWANLHSDVKVLFMWQAELAAIIGGVAVIAVAVWRIPAKLAALSAMRLGLVVAAAWSLTNAAQAALTPMGTGQYTPEFPWSLDQVLHDEFLCRVVGSAVFGAVYLLLVLLSGPFIGRRPAPRWVLLSEQTAFLGILTISLAALVISRGMAAGPVPIATLGATIGVGLVVAMVATRRRRMSFDEVSIAMGSGLWLTAAYCFVATVQFATAAVRFSVWWSHTSLTGWVPESDRGTFVSSAGVFMLGGLLALTMRPRVRRAP